MHHHRSPIALTISALAAAALLAGALPAEAQGQTQNPGWFVPGGQATPGRTAAPARPSLRQAPRQSPPLQDQGQQPAIQAPLAPDGQLGGEPNLPQIPLPPVPDLPALPRGASPPAAVVGVLGVPEIMHASTAAQAIEKVIGARREKLNEDAQKEQTVWRDMQQTLAAQRATLPPDQLRTKEHDLQERITTAQRTFRDRNRVIQEAAQYSLGQIERTLIAVIRQVSESRGMNLVLHRSQVALNVNEFDITEQVVEQVNKVMPTVNIPPEGVSPAAFAAAQPNAPPPASPSTPPQAQPASATTPDAPPGPRAATPPVASAPAGPRR